MKQVLFNAHPYQLSNQSSMENVAGGYNVVIKIIQNNNNELQREKILHHRLVLL